MDNRIYFPKDGDGIPRIKIFENEEQDYYFDSIIDEMGTFTNAREELIQLFGNIDVFDTPKPVKVLKELIRATTKQDDIILDFFAGSATTAHACMQLNAEDGGNRKFIMAQLPEPTFEVINRVATPKKNCKNAFDAGYRTIDQISRKRIELATEKIKQDTGKDIDYGFKHYYVQTPNVETIDKILEFDPCENKMLAENMISEFDCDKAKGEDVILTTWLIDDGYPINTNVEKLKFGDYIAHYINNQKLYLIEQGWGVEQTKELLEKIGKYNLNVSTIIVYGYSFTLESLSELETNVKTNLENKITIEKRY